MMFGQELVVLYTTLSMFGKFRCMLGVSVEVRMKNILYQFMEGQPRLGLPRGAKMSLALNEPK